MATLNLRRFSRPDRLKTIEPKHLLALLTPYHDFFSSRDVDLSRLSRPTESDYDGLAQVFMQPDSDTPEQLLAMVYFIDEMATDSGMDDILSACARRGIDLDSTERETPADVAVQAWLRDPDIVQRAHAERKLTQRRSFEYFRTLSSPVPAWKRPHSRTLRALEKHLDDWFARKRRGRGARVFVFERPDGIWFLVRHGSPMQRAGVMKAGASSSVVFRPEVYDVLTYDRAKGEIGMNANSVGEKELYRKQFGRHLFGDADFFVALDKFTLEPLRKRGVEALACTDIDGIDQVRLRQIEYWRGGGARETEIRRADDVFAAYAERGASMPAKAKIICAKFEVKFSDAASPRMVTIRLPKKTQYMRDDDSTALERWLRDREFIIDA